MDPQAALSSLLRGRSPYDERPGAVGIAPFKLASLSLPDDIHRCPKLAALLPEAALSLLEGYQERMLAPEGAIVDIREFLDPTLRFNQKKYQRLISDLCRRGLVRPSLSCRERVGLFTVWKVKGET